MYNLNNGSNHGSNNQNNQNNPDSSSIPVVSSTLMGRPPRRTSYHGQPDHSELYRLCAIAERPNWDAVRRFLNRRSSEQVYAAATFGSQHSVTALHAACRNEGPPDVVEKLLAAAPEVLRKSDSHGWLPLHYAAANGASDTILQLLVDRFPDGAKTGDHQGRAPLHFALSTRGPALAPTAAALLAGGSHCRDAGGMLPLHYACAYGAPVEVVEILAQRLGPGNDQTYTADNSMAHATDDRGMIPVHYTCGNPYTAAAPEVTEYLLDLYPGAVNVCDNNGNLPLRSLAKKTSLQKDAARTPTAENPAKILDLHLRAVPDATADFLTALQALPDWLRERAVVNPTVQDILNKKIAKRFPTFIMIIDFFVYVAIIVSFSIGVQCSIEQRSMLLEMENVQHHHDRSLAELPDCSVFSWVLASCSFYFLLRELVQILSLMSLGLLKTWLWDLTNWIDVMLIVMGLFFAGDMLTGESDLDRFRWLSSSALLLFWVAILSFLRSKFIDFAVFVSGLYNVVIRLFAFLVALAIILISFAVCFVMIYFDSSLCAPCDVNTAGGDAGLTCDADYEKLDHFCIEGEAILKVYTMLLGEVNDENFLDPTSGNKNANFIELANHYSFREILGIGYFALFMFLVVILLANVLIAIVTDSYGVIKNERAAIVFWSNRLDFVAEMDVIFYGPWRSKVRSLLPGQLAAQQQNNTKTNDSNKPPQNESSETSASSASMEGRHVFGNGVPGSLPALSSVSLGNISMGQSYSNRGRGGGDPNHPLSQERFGEALWDMLVRHGRAEVPQTILSTDFLLYLLVRFTSIVVMLVVLCLGLITAGLLWPPQVREWLFVQQGLGAGGGAGEAKELEKRSIEVRALKEEVQDLQNEIVQEMSADRREVVAMKAQFGDMKNDLQNEMKHIKGIVMTLFELQAQQGM